MALTDDIQQQAPQQGQEIKEPRGEKMTDDEEDELKILVGLSQNLIDDGGIDVIKQAMNSSDPGQVIGQFMMQMLSQLGEALKQYMDFSKRIVFAHGGWIEQVSDYLQEEYDVPRDVMDRAEIYIGTTATQMAGGAQQQAQGLQQAAPGGQPAMPQAPNPGGM